jgi:anti-sigma regulatory factor (Ser/Thr protein kinase)
MLELYHERLPATPAAVRLVRHGVSDALTEAGVSDVGLLADIALAVSEATTNAVRHAYPAGTDGHIEVIVIRTAERIAITVSDEGAGMEDALNHTGGLGVGLALMNSQTERLDIASDTTGTIVTLHFAFSEAESGHHS